MNVIALVVLMVGTGALLLLGAPELLAEVPVLGNLVKFTTMPIPNFSAAKVTQHFKDPGHNGVDFGIPIGTPLLCCASGVVVQVNNDPNKTSGRFVIVKGRLPFSPTIAWSYSHLSRVDVRVGQDVEAGDVIGLSGNSGLTRSGGVEAINRTDGKGAHLHFAVLDAPRGFKSIDPEPFFPEPIRETESNV